MTTPAKPAKRQRVEGTLHRSLPATLTIRAAEPGQADDGLLRLRLSVSSETACLRQSWWDDPWIEILGHKDGEIELQRLNDGAAVLANHDRWRTAGNTPLAGIGAVERAWLEGGRLMADLIISRREALADLRQDIADNLVRNVSIGYSINERVLTKAAKDGPSEYRVTNWTPFEISLVDIPFDATVGLGRSADQPENAAPRYRVVDLPPAGETTGARNMPEDDEVLAPAAATPTAPAQPAARGADPMALERTRAREIRTLGRQHNMTELADKAIDAGTTLDAFRAQVLERMQASGRLRPAESPEIGMSEREVRQFSFLRAMIAASDPAIARDVAPFEMECSRAAQEKRDESRAKDRPGAVTIPIDVLSRGIQMTDAAALSAARMLIGRAKRSAVAGMEYFRDLNVGNATQGGNLVATELLGTSFIELLREAMVLDSMGITWLRDLNGNIAIPSQTGAATHYWLAEGGTPTESQQAVGQMVLTPKTVGAYTDYTRRLLMQSSIDVEAFVRADLAAIIARAIQAAAINGSGASNEPTGLLNLSGIGSVAGGTNGGAPTYDLLVDLETAVGNANAEAGTLGFLTNTKVRGKLRKTQEFASTNGKAVWTSVRDNGRTLGDVLGYDGRVTNAVPSNLTKGTAVGICSAIAYGNWADLIIGLWGGLDIILDPYALSTSGGRRVVALQDCDVNARHVASFAVMKDALTT